MELKSPAIRSLVSVINANDFLENKSASSSRPRQINELIIRVGMKNEQSKELIKNLLVGRLN